MGGSLSDSVLDIMTRIPKPQCLGPRFHIVFGQHTSCGGSSKASLPWNSKFIEGTRGEENRGQGLGSVIQSPPFFHLHISPPGQSAVRM